MNAKRFPWEALLALALGIGLGLYYAWVISPVRLVDAPPAVLRADFKDQYRSAIAASYNATLDLERARKRLSLLNDPDPLQALSAQAQRMLADGESGEAIKHIANLASALQGNANFLPTETPTIESTQAVVDSTPTATESALEVTSTAPPSATSTTAAQLTSTPRPTLPPTPTPGTPYELVAQDTICDPNLAEGLLQVVVTDATRKPTPGAAIIIAWNGSEEHIFTGFKPELGHGYADFLMTPDVTYTIRMANGGTTATNIAAPLCTASDGNPYLGGMRIAFQQK